jgi:hypothetical protein
MSEITNKGEKPREIRQLFTVKTDDGKLYYHVVDRYQDLLDAHRNHVDTLGLDSSQKVINTTHTLGPVIIHP